MAVGGLGAAIALRSGSASVVQASSRSSSSSSSSPRPSSRSTLMIEPARTIAEYNPLSFVVEGVREPIISGIDASDTLTRCWRSAGIVALGLVLSARALRHRLRVG
jgi:ABC-2 type transport system permease protein